MKAVCVCVVCRQKGNTCKFRRPGTRVGLSMHYPSCSGGSMSDKMVKGMF